MADEIVGDFPRTRKEAQDTGAKRYFTGEACGNGHTSLRLASNGVCIGCTQAWYAANAKKSIDAARAWQAANPERLRETSRAYYAANAEKHRDNNRAWVIANQDRNRERQRAYRAAHREKYREHSRRWNKENRDKYRDKYRESQRIYQATSEKSKTAHRAYRLAHPEMMRKCRAAWKDANPDKVRALDHKRRARKHNAEGKHTAADIVRIRKAQKDKCAYCAKVLKGKGHVDHILALSRGGRNSPENLQLLCETCNTSKGARDAVEFAQSRGFLI